MQDHVLSFLSAYQETLSEAFSLPDALAKEYALFDCLRDTPQKAVYLLRKQSDDSLAVLKVAKGSAREPLRAEYELLHSLDTPEFPRAICYLPGEQADLFLRSYIEGTPVSNLVERNGLFSEKEALRLVGGLCKALRFLHAQTPPIIHRDIKPQNVIYTKQHTLALIDFDAARHFHAEQKMDTVFLGTQATAAPEQFGYQQTDQRADIYSTGILLLFLCTGSYELESLTQLQSHALRHVIKTCTRFDPARRYRSISHLQKALLAALYTMRPRVMILRGAALGFVAGIALTLSLVFAGLLPLQEDAKKAAIAEQTPQPTAAPVLEQAIEFDSPEIERAVREQLGISEETPLYQDDLDRVKTLYLCGTTTKEYWGDVTTFCYYRSTAPSGTIETLADIPKLHFLSELAVCNQRITDLSPLKGTKLTRLAVNGNYISDLSQLSSLTNLQELYAGHNPISTIDALKPLIVLQVVDFSTTTVSDLSPLNNNIKTLWLNDTPILDFTQLLPMTQLESLAINKPGKKFYDVLPQLQSLVVLELGLGQAELAPVLQLKNLTALALAPSSLTSIEGIQALQHLTYFRITAMPNLDLTPLTKLPNLTELDIFSQPLNDYSVLFRLPKLKSLFCSAEQKSEIEALGRELTFVLYPQ